MKTNLVNNMLLFTKKPDVMVSQMGDKLQEVVMETAALACDSHPWIGKAEFTVLCMKFANNRHVSETVNYLDQKLSKMIDFDQQMSSFLEKKSVFTELIMHMQAENELICNAEV